MSDEVTLGDVLLSLALVGSAVYGIGQYTFATMKGYYDIHIRGENTRCARLYAHPFNLARWNLNFLFGSETSFWRNKTAYKELLEKKKRERMECEAEDRFLQGIEALSAGFAKRLEDGTPKKEILDYARGGIEMCDRMFPQYRSQKNGEKTEERILAQEDRRK